MTHETDAAEARRRKPQGARVGALRVRAVRALSEGFVRVTLRSEHADPLGLGPGFDGMGFDQWFRLFLPAPSGELHLPFGDAEGWYTRWLAMDETMRPAVRNYTVREARRDDAGWNIDVDFVVHRSASGSIDGTAARWAADARPGDTVGLLDQGTIFAPIAGAEHTLVVTDETGLPGAEAIARSLAPGTAATFVLEVANDVDRRAIASPAAIAVEWVARNGSRALPGRAAIARVEQLVAGGAMPLGADSYVYVVGEASFALDTRALARAAGVPKSSVDFCAYWRPERRPG